MPRGPRVDAPGCIHHVLVRGVERRLLFLDDEDRRDYLARLGALIPELGTGCYAWALMPNHVHLVLRTGPVPLAKLMARVGTGYVRRFNERHDRVGHLFQNRFKSIRVEDETQMLTVVRYVHLNPVRAGLTTAGALQRYPWTGHAALMGRVSNGFQDVISILDRFHRDPETARRHLTQWMKEDRGSEALPPDAEGGNGSEALVQRLIQEVCQKRGIDVPRLLGGSRSRAVVEARLEITVRACSEPTLLASHVARGLRISQSAVCQIRSKAARLPRGQLLNF